ncbi:MAG: hypothetical protein GY777_27430 [Candidatus Brocadiaceae bacterium]|nr:hypothetical protein [Candidatus Brocadiaceae bacterium]
MDKEILSWQTCNYCESSGWLLNLNSDGLCDSCNKILSSRIKRTIQIITKTSEAIDKVKRLNTKLSQLSLIENVVQKRILPLEKKGIKSTNQTSFQILEQVKSWRDEIISKHLEDLLSKTKIKVEKTMTEELKANSYLEVLNKITELKDKVSKTDIISNFENKVKQQLDEIKLHTISDATHSSESQIMAENDMKRKEQIPELFVSTV